MAKEKQLEFPFVKEQNQLDGKTCENCKFYDEKTCICHRWGDEHGEGDSCGVWEYNIDKAQKEDSKEFEDEFNNLCDMYGITEKDRERLKNLCRLL